MCKLYGREYMKSIGIRQAIPWVQELLAIADHSEREEWDSDDVKETAAEWLKKLLVN